MPTMHGRPTTTPEVHQFLQNRAYTRPANSVPNVGVDGDVATIRLFDPIDNWGGWWGMSAAELADAVDGLGDISEIRLLINSPGGDVFDGVAIMNILSAHPARVVAVVQGLAASAASFIAVGADELVMNPGSMLMIHDASTGVYGWASDLREMADLLDQISDNIASLYARKAGADAATWRARMKDETWYTADEALAAGLADAVAPASEDDALEDPTPGDPASDEDGPVIADRLTVADATRILSQSPAATGDEVLLIDPHPGDDADDTPVAGDPPSHLASMAMRLALVTA